MKHIIKINKIKMAYSFKGEKLIEFRTIPNETLEQMWNRLRHEEERLEQLEIENQAKIKPWQRHICTLPMTEDMISECRRITMGIRRAERQRRRNKRSRFTSAKQEKETLEVEEIVSVPAQPLSRTQNPLLDGCRSVEEYEPLNKIDEGSYGIVYRAKEKATSKIYAIKKVKLERDKEGFPITALREIILMKRLNHPNIVKVKEVVFGNSLDKVFVVMDYIEHEIKSLVEQSYELMSAPKAEGVVMNPSYLLTTVEIKCIMKQLLKGVMYMHEKWIMHRDLKTSNLL